MDDPYESVDWDGTERLHSINHVHTFSGNPGEDFWPRGEGHLDGEAVFDSMYDRGIRHFAISNYHPSKPTYPLSEYFEDVPPDALGCPNGEHGARGKRGHYTAPGSDFETYSGHDGDWRDLFEKLLSGLRYDGGGGIVINHPVRTGLSIEGILDRFDFDERVLGIEAYNHRCETKYGGTGDALSVWDELLMTGRPVFGFFNPDYHSDWGPNPWATEAWGRNVLLVPEATEADAARAYRQGHTYGALRGIGITFERIDATDDAITVEVSDPGRIDFVSDRIVVQTDHGSEATYEVDGKETYVRIEAQGKDAGDRIFSQAIRFDHDVGGTERHT